MIDSTIIEAESLKKSYGDAHVLRDIGLTIHEKEVLAIMGPSGSGKSTLLHCLAGIIKPDSGKIMYRGQDITALSSGSLAKLRRTEFGFVFQFGELVPELPVRENVALPLLLRDTPKQQAYSIAEKWLGMVDMQHFLHKLPSTLSGGELQRVAVARAMAIDPKVIFADEPTGSLDSRNSQHVMDLLVDLAQKHNKAVVIVTHAQEIAAYADKVITIRDGAIADSKIA